MAGHKVAHHNSPQIITVRSSMIEISIVAKLTTKHLNLAIDILNYRAIIRIGNRYD